MEYLLRRLPRSGIYSTDEGTASRKKQGAKAHLEDPTGPTAACDAAVHQAVAVEPRAAPFRIWIAGTEMLVSLFILRVNDAGEERRDET